MNWVDLMDKVKRDLDIESDRKLAKLISVAPQQISAVRKGGTMPLQIKLKLLDKRGYKSLQEALLIALDDDYKEELKKKNNDLTKRIKKLS